MITTDRNVKKIEAIMQMCRAAISQQVERGKKSGFGLDDYTDGRIVGGASLARKILRVFRRGEENILMLARRSPARAVCQNAQPMPVSK